jgi:hypothetical protein
VQWINTIPLKAINTASYINTSSWFSGIRNIRIILFNYFCNSYVWFIVSLSLFPCFPCSFLLHVHMFLLLFVSSSCCFSFRCMSTKFLSIGSTYSCLINSLAWKLIISYIFIARQYSSNLRTPKPSCKELTIVVLRYFPIILKHLFCINRNFLGGGGIFLSISTCSDFITKIDGWSNVFHV